MSEQSSDIVIIGASGFIGKHLVNKIVNDQNYKIRLLKHKNLTSSEGPRIEIIAGDLFNLDSLNELITETSIVVNLVYLVDKSFQENLDAISNIIKVCIEKKAKRLIHCSTAVVCGRAENNFISEETPSIPFDEYEIIKVAIENLLIKECKDHLELAIVRPTCVFGPNGKNLLKLINDLKNGNKFFNYLKSCLYNKRTMNLVSVHNVVSAIDFLIQYKSPLEQDVFLVADDEDLNNNFRDIEKKLMKDLGLKDYFFPRLVLPSSILSLVLKLSKKSNITPKRKFKTDKLKNIGWKSNHALFPEISSLLNSDFENKQ